MFVNYIQGEINVLFVCEINVLFYDKMGALYCSEILWLPIL